MSVINARIFSRATIASALAALVLCAVCLMGCSTVTTGEESPQTPVGQIVPARLAIVHTGALAGSFASPEPGQSGASLAAVAARAHELEQEGYDVLLLDSGDTLLGSDLADLSDAEMSVGLLNAAGYDALAVGARELSLSPRLLARRSSQADFALLSSNLIHDEGGSPTAAHATFKLSDGRTIGVFGLSALPEAVATGLAANLAATEEELVAIAQEQVGALRKQGCKLVVCLCNLGDGTESSPSAKRLAGQVQGIDIVLDITDGKGGYQAAADASGDETLVVRTPARLAGASLVLWEEGTLRAQALDLTQDTQDDQVAALLNQTVQEQQAWLKDTMAESPRTLSAKHVATRECGLGDLVADAALWEARHAGARVAPDAAIVDAGSICASLPKGTITREDLFTTCPHALTRLYTLQASGSQLVDALDAAFAASAQTVSFPQVSGLTATYAAKTANDAPHTSLSHVGDDGFDPTARYTLVVTQNVLENPAYQALLSADDTPVSLDTSAGKALASFLDKSCHGSVPETYRSASGRVTLAGAVGSKKAT